MKPGVVISATTFSVDQRQRLFNLARKTKIRDSCFLSRCGFCFVSQLRKIIKIHHSWKLEINNFVGLPDLSRSVFIISSPPQSKKLKQRGSISLSVTALVLDLACCVYIRKKTFSTSQNNIAFIWDKCCHLTMSLHLMNPNLLEWSDWERRCWIWDHNCYWIIESRMESIIYK